MLDQCKVVHPKSRNIYYASTICPPLSHLKTNIYLGGGYVFSNLKWGKLPYFTTQDWGCAAMISAQLEWLNHSTSYINVTPGWCHTKAQNRSDLGPNKVGAFTTQSHRQTTQNNSRTHQLSAKEKQEHFYTPNSISVQHSVLPSMQIIINHKYKQIVIRLLRSLKLA